MATTPRLSSRDTKETEAIQQTARLKTVNPDEKPEEKTEPDIHVEVEGEETPKVEVETARVEDKKVEAAGEEPGVEALKKQIEDLTNYRAVENRRLQAAVQEAQHRAREAEAYKQQAFNSQYDMVVNTLNAAQLESESAAQQYAIALQSQDWVSAAEAQKRMARAEAMVAKMEDGKRAYEDVKNRPQQELQSQPQWQEPAQQQASLLPQEQAWLNMHPEVMKNQVLNEKLNAAYYTAMNRGLQRGTQPYFDYIEQELGYRARSQGGQAAGTVQSAAGLDPSLVAAPVSRESQSMATGELTQRKTFRLTKEQAEVAKASGLTPQEYAKQLIKLEEMKKSDPERYYGRS